MTERPSRFGPSTQVSFQRQKPACGLLGRCGLGWVFGQQSLDGAVDHTDRDLKKNAFRSDTAPGASRVQQGSCF